ncbi:MAG: SoxR reducing system RseC family protein [Pseudomonadota bacterium]
MIEQPVVVMDVDPAGRALVETQAAGACGSCGSRASCGTSLLSAFFGNRGRQFWVDNILDATRGERLILGISEQRLLVNAVLAYLFPLLGLLGGAILADRLGAGEGGELLIALAAFAGLALGVLEARRRLARDARAPRRGIRMLRKEPIRGTVVSIG